MKTQFLLPHSFKKVGWVLLAIAILLFIFQDIEFLKGIRILAIYNSGYPLVHNDGVEGFFKIIKHDTQLDLASTLFIIGGLFVAFARVKNEDEFISKIRLESLVWATWAQFIILTLMILSVFGIGFLNILMLNMFTILILFIIRFHFVLYKSRKSLSDEE